MARRELGRRAGPCGLWGLSKATDHAAEARGATAPGSLVPSGWSNLNFTGITCFVLIDASDYSTGDGQEKFVIHTPEATTSSNRRTLDVN